MEKITISPLADRNEKLGEIYDYLDQLKDALSDIVYDMDEEDEDEAETVDTLTNALEQIDDALDAIADVIAIDVRNPIALLRHLVHCWPEVSFFSPD